MFNPITVNFNSSTIRQLVSISCLVILFSLILPATALAGPPLPKEMERCTVCHKEETAAWQKSAHAEAAGSQETNRATCKDCHNSPSFEDHPANGAMQLPVTASICEDCHTGAFEQWAGDSHGQNDVQCLECHQSHSQEFQLSDKALCASCHQDKLEDSFHTAHSSDTNCIDCHLAPTSAGHTFSDDPSENCVKCHEQHIVSKEDASAQCGSCHPEKTAAWENSPHANAVSHGVHGATCEDCHGTFVENHPKKGVMKLTTDSSVCGTCHIDTFEQWANSHHAQNGVQCIGCHLSHSQEFRLTDDALCGSCHRDRMEDFSHSTHSEANVTCVDCHLTPIHDETALVSASNGGIRAPNHNFSAIPSENCTNCHNESIHEESLNPHVDQATATQLKEKADLVPELADKLETAERTNESLQTMSLLSLGLGIGVGGIMGAIFVLVVGYLTQRRTQ